MERAKQGLGVSSNNLWSCYQVDQKRLQDGSGGGGGGDDEEGRTNEEHKQ
jgi:hypothetical protein